MIEIAEVVLVSYSSREVETNGRRKFQNIEIMHVIFQRESICVIYNIHVLISI